MITKKSDLPQTRPSWKRFRFVGLAAVALLLLTLVGMAMDQIGREAERRDIRDQALAVRALVRDPRHARDAETMLKKLLSEAPDSPEAHLAYADLLRARGAWLPAGEEYRTCLRLRPKWVPALLGLGAVALENQFDQIAVDAFDEAIRHDPGNAEAWIGLGRAHYQQRQRYDRSLEAFQQAARLAPERTDFFSYYAEALRSTYRHEEAEAVLRRRLSAEPTDVRSRYLLAEALLETRITPDRVAEAEQHLRTVMRLQPEATLPRLTLAGLLLDRKDPHQAIGILESALRHEPNNRRIVTALARAYHAAGRRSEAKAAQAKAKQIAAYMAQADQMEASVRKSDDPELLRRFATLLHNAGQADRARAYLQFAETLERSERDRGTPSVSAPSSPPPTPPAVGFPDSR